MFHSNAQSRGPFPGLESAIGDAYTNNISQITQRKFLSKTVETRSPGLKRIRLPRDFRR